MAAGRTAGFYRYSENRPIKSDVSGFDEYLDAPEVERASVEDHIPEENNGYKLISKMGWCKGRGLGREEQGDRDPIPFRPKDDHMGIGRWQFELENAQDATEKRRQLEIEKEITPELAEQYKAHADKEKKMAEVIAEMKKSFYCQLCDKQYNNYKEYDNHINSYSHAHNQRLKQLKEYEIGRRFGGRKDKESEQEKQRAQRIVAKERALMNMKRQVAFASGGMLSAFKPVGDGSHEQGNGSHEQPTTSLQSSRQCSDSNPQPTTSSYSTPTLYYPMVASTASQSWEPSVLIKPHPPTTTETTATPIKRKSVKEKKVKKKKKKQEVDHSGFVPRKIAKTSSTVRNPLLVTPLPLEKKEEKESVKETDDLLFSLYDDFDVAPAVAPPTDHTSCSGSSIWDKFEATVVQQQQQQQQSDDSEGSCDVSSEGEEECLEATPTMDDVSQPVAQENTSTDNIIESANEVQGKSGSGSLQQPNESQPVVQAREESKNERLLRLLGMPMKSFLSAGHQCPLKDHTSVKVTNSGSYLDKPHPSKYCTPDNRTTTDQTSMVTLVNNDKAPKLNTQRLNDIKKPDGLSFGLSKKREKLRQATTAGELFDKEDSN